MKSLLARIKRQPGAPATEDAGFFAPLTHDSHELSPSSWAVRAPRIDAQPFDRRQGTELFLQLWNVDGHVVALDSADLLRMSQYLEFVHVPADREVIGQDEVGSYMLVVLEGTVAVDRGPAWGGKVRLAEARPGEMLGEMSLLDGGVRFSSCRTLTPCTLAVIDARCRAACRCACDRSAPDCRPCCRRSEPHAPAEDAAWKETRHRSSSMTCCA